MARLEIAAAKSPVKSACFPICEYTAACRNSFASADSGYWSTTHCKLQTDDVFGYTDKCDIAFSSKDLAARWHILVIRRRNVSSSCWLSNWYSKALIARHLLAPENLVSYNPPAERVRPSTLCLRITGCRFVSQAITATARFHWVVYSTISRKSICKAWALANVASAGIQLIHLRSSIHIALESFGWQPKTQKSAIAALRRGAIYTTPVVATQNSIASLMAGIFF